MDIKLSNFYLTKNSQHQPFGRFTVRRLMLKFISLRNPAYKVSAFKFKKYGSK